MDGTAQCIYKNDGITRRSLSECTGEPDYESLGASLFVEDLADENVTGPLLGSVYQIALHTTPIFCSVCKLSAIFILGCPSEKRHRCGNQSH